MAPRAARIRLHGSGRVVQAGNLTDDAVLDGEARDSGCDGEPHVLREALGLRRKARLEVGVDRDIDGRAERRQVSQDVGEAHRVVRAPGRPGEARAGRREGGESQVLEESRLPRPKGWATRSSPVRGARESGLFFPGRSSFAPSGSFAWPRLSTSVTCPILTSRAARCDPREDRRAAPVVARRFALGAHEAHAFPARHASYAGESVYPFSPVGEYQCVGSGSASGQPFLNRSTRSGLLM